MNYWLVKTEPTTFSWSDLVRDKKTTWDGVRNHLAKKYLTSMKKGDLVFVYHSVSEKQIVGIARVVSEPYNDPTDIEQKGWISVDMVPDRKLENPVTLAIIKKDHQFANLLLVRQGRIYVIPVSKREWFAILKYSQCV